MRQFEQYAPPPFPVTLVYIENGDGIQLPPESPPVGAKPGAYEQPQHYDRNIIHDWRIRSSIEQALLMAEEDISAMTKLVAEAQADGAIEELATVKLVYPNKMPGVKSGVGNNNEAIQGFVNAVHERLAIRFGEQSWQDWCIVQFFPKDDDMRQVVNLCLFVLNEGLSANREQDAGDDYDEGAIEKDLTVELDPEAFTVV